MGTCSRFQALLRVITVIFRRQVRAKAFRFSSSNVKIVFAHHLTHVFLDDNDYQ